MGLSEDNAIKLNPATGFPAGSVRLQREDTNTIAVAAAVAADNALDQDGSREQTPSMVASDGVAAVVDEASLLKGLTENVRDQEDLERDITRQAEMVMIEQEDERDQKRIDKAEGNIEKLDSQKKTQQRKLNTLTNNPLMRARTEQEISRLGSEIAGLKKDISDIQGRIEERHKHVEADDQQADTISGNQRLPNESQRDFLIRTGKITPFSRMPARPSREPNADLRETMLDAEEEAHAGEEEADAPSIPGEAEPRSHQNLRLPGFADAPESLDTTPDSEFSLRSRKRRKVGDGSGSSRRKVSPADDTADDFTPGETDEDLDDFIENEDGTLMTSKSSKRKTPAKVSEKNVDLAAIDDGNENMYQARLKRWVDKRSAARRRKLQQNEASEEELAAENAEDEEWFKPCPDAPDHQFENDLKLPGDIYPALFDYQKTGVQWLGELYSQSVGGIVGDEMGLGKTIQIISFLAGLHYSKKITKPIIVVAPATVLRQWVNEFHRWWPPLRVSILHSSGSGLLNVDREDRYEEDEEEVKYDYDFQRTAKKPRTSSKAVQRIVNRVVQHGHVLVTTYAGLQTYADVLVPVEWDYAVLDEGHKIRNPNTGITISCKELKTPNRVILSGTPMQNNLIELWSLFDFVFPMRLGTLVNFRAAFEVPIKLGGYANASNLQIMTATQCAEALKSTISPYLLQRLKVDVAADLPKKSEQVLFCKLTKPQREAYEMFLASDDMNAIYNKSRNSLFGIDILRKICNHPDLLDPNLKVKPGYKWGNPNKSGKMQVVKALVQMWKDMGHKTSLFSQGVLMLNIIEDFIKSLDGFNYLRMDGSTNVRDRQTLVDRFDNDPDLHIFLLTTKVGGLGVNLTGANRVIIFDPDWNPSTDVQARERAWRLGQKKEVTIFRLMTAGTIEEKIYHRQIFKQFLTNKILKDPKQRSTFDLKDLYDLFTLGSTEDGTTMTGQMFKGTEVQFNQESQPVGTAEHSALPQENGDTSSSVKGGPSTDENLLSLDGVASLEVFRGNPDDDKPADSEARLMEGLFANSGVHSALEHDQIINGKKKIAPDRAILERDAKKVAAAAAQQLRRAGIEAQSVVPGTVTWTGTVGSAGRPGNIRRGAGPSSSSVLSGFANRPGNSNTASTSSSRSGTPASGERVPGAQRGKDFMKLIQTFIRTHGGKVPSAMLVNHFNRMCTTPKLSAEFKHMLKEIAFLEEGSGQMMRAKWVLKDEFK